MAFLERDGHHQDDQRLLHLLGDASSQPEVEQPHHVPLQHQEISGVRVAVEQPVLKDLSKGALDDVPGQRRPVVLA